MTCLIWFHFYLGKLYLVIMFVGLYCFLSFVINHFLTKEHIRKVVTTKQGNFLIHFPVVRTYKDTSRIVFDASVKIDKISVNNLIHAAPKLQNDLFDVLIWSRRNIVAVVCDISEMYFQIKIRPDDCRYLLFWWRNTDQLKELSCYEFQGLLFWFEICTFWSSVHFSEECKRKLKRVTTSCGNRFSGHIHGR